MANECTFVYEYALLFPNSRLATIYHQESYRSPVGVGQSRLTEREREEEATHIHEGGDEEVQKLVCYVYGPLPQSELYH